MLTSNNPFADLFKPTMTNELADLFKPVQVLVEINTKTVEALVSLQKASAEDLTNASVAQFKALCECKDPKAVLDLQVTFYKSVEAKLAETTEQSIAAMTSAKDAYVATVEESGKKVTEMAEETVKKVSELKVA